MAILSESLHAAVAAVVEMGVDAPSFAAMSDEALMDAQVTISTLTKLSQTIAASAAGELSRRSPHDAGYTGLAQRKGFGNATGLLQVLTHVPRAEAAKYVAVGLMMAPTPVPSARSIDGAAAPWHSEVGRAVSTGALSLDAADAIRRGLGEPDAAVSVGDLAAAADLLLAEAPTVTIEQLTRHARQLRDLLDEDGIARREKARHDLRFVKKWVRADGMYQASILLDPENGMILFSALDQITAPRRNGPRFIEAGQKAWAAKIVADPRTDEQLLADALIQMVRLAGDADPGTFFGGRRPAVRVIVTETVLRDRAGHGFLDGDSQPVAFETVERHLCDTGAVAVAFDDEGQCINVGRTQRLFTTRQRIGLVVRDGGCLWPDCEKPASTAEAHHIDAWTADHGKTNLEDGVLLCRHHHMFLHNNHWQIRRDGARYWLKPPRAEDPDTALIPMRSKSPQMHELYA